jgi:hypothetical protein
VLFSGHDNPWLELGDLRLRAVLGHPGPLHCRPHELLIEGLGLFLELPDLDNLEPSSVARAMCSMKPGTCCGRAAFMISACAAS